MGLVSLRLEHLFINIQFLLDLHKNNYNNVLRFRSQTNHILPASKKGPSTSRVVKVQRCELANGDKDRSSNIMNLSIIEL